jgi:NAD(P)H-dependent FMN reductase
VNELVQQCIKSNILLFSTPSYNASVSPVLKNAFDWLSRPSSIYENKVPVFGKKAALMSTSYISQEQLKDCVKMGAYRKL